MPDLIKNWNSTFFGSAFTIAFYYSFIFHCFIQYSSILLLQLYFISLTIYCSMFFFEKIQILKTQHWRLLNVLHWPNTQQIHQLQYTNTPVTKYSVFAVYYANMIRCRVFIVDLEYVFFQIEHVLPYSKECFLKVCFQSRCLNWFG